MKEKMNPLIPGFVIVADWGTETTCVFRADRREAQLEYEDALNQGADVVLASVIKKRINK